MIDINLGLRQQLIGQGIPAGFAQDMAPINNRNILEKLSTQLQYIVPNNIADINFTGFFKRMIIDHFFVSRKLLERFNVTTNILRSYVSDHYPVILDISPRLPEPPQTQAQDNNPILGHNNNTGTSFMRDNNITTNIQLLEYYFTRPLFSETFPDIENLRNNINKQHIIKYNNSYWRFDSLVGNRLTLYSILSGDKKIYSKKYKNRSSCK